MNNTFHTGTHASLEKAAAAIIDDVKIRTAEFVRSSGSKNSEQTGMRWEAVIPKTEPLAWLNHHDNLIRMYCSNREKVLKIAAIGVADMLRYKDEEVAPREAVNYVFERLEQLPKGARYYGGLRFYDESTSGDTSWQRFGRVRFVLPSIELIQDENQTTLTANLVLSDNCERSAGMLLAMLNEQNTPPPLASAHLPVSVSRANVPDRDQWESMMARVHDLMNSGELKKVVLARRSVFDFGEDLKPMALLSRLHEASPDSFHFCFNYGNEIAFIGATPERLYQRTGRNIVSEALAGTRPRGATEDDDQWLESELVASGKERAEHSLVADAIELTLKEYCESVSRHPQPEVLKLRYVQHLRTVLTGTLKDGVSDADLLLALHPTPAVGGVPKESALRHIMELEPFDRGWYASPIGWVMRDEVEFAVGIRCALVEGSTLSLYSGAGIMPESDTEQEWREIESKIGNFVRILTS